MWKKRHPEKTIVSHVARSILSILEELSPVHIPRNSDKTPPICSYRAVVEADCCLRSHWDGSDGPGPSNHVRGNPHGEGNIGNRPCSNYLLLTLAQKHPEVLILLHSSETKPSSPPRPTSRGRSCALASTVWGSQRPRCRSRGAMRRNGQLTSGRLTSCTDTETRGIS